MPTPYVKSLNLQNGHDYRPNQDLGKTQRDTRISSLAERNSDQLSDIDTDWLVGSKAQVFHSTPLNQDSLIDGVIRVFLHPHPPFQVPLVPLYTVLRG